MLTNQQTLAQIGGLLLVVAVIAVLMGARRAYLAVVARRVHRAAGRPVPGRTRDISRRAA